MNIFYINLDKHRERRESMEKQLSSLGLSYERMPAVYGRDLSRDELDELYCKKKALRRQSMPLCAAHIGCSASQILVYREIVRRNLPYTLILEDDVVLTDKVAEALDEIVHLIDPERPEILLLSPAHAKLTDDKTVRKQGSYRAAPFASGVYTSSYIVTHSAAQSLLKELYPVGDVADCWARLNRFKVVDIFVLQPHLIEQDQETFGSSTTAGFQPFANSVAKAVYKLRRLRCVVLDRITAPWRRRFHPYNDVLKGK